MQKNTHCRYDIKYPAQNFFYFQTASPLHYHLLSRLRYNIPQNIRLSKTKLFKKSLKREQPYRSAPPISTFFHRMQIYMI